MNTRADVSQDLGGTLGNGTVKDHVTGIGQSSVQSNLKEVASKKDLELAEYKAR